MPADLDRRLLAVRLIASKHSLRIGQLAVCFKNTATSTTLNIRLLSHLPPIYYLSIDLIKQISYHSNMNTYDIFNALAEPTRRDIIEMLATKGQLSASDISTSFKVSAPAISQHLKVLREARLVNMQKRAQQRIYQINPDAMSELEEWARKMKKMWHERFDRLDAVLQEEKAKLLLFKSKK